MDDQEEWSSDANEALEISLVQAGSNAPKSLSTYHPRFTYPIFGEEERIFGYQGLHINLRFAAHDLRPNLEISYDKKFKAVGDTKATDIEETFKEWTPAETFKKTSNFNTLVQNDASAKDFKPPGKLIKTYTSKGRNFEIWCGELTDPAVQRIIERVQILVSFFIEGGTPLALDDEDWRWLVFFVYETSLTPPNPTPTTSPYSIVGYSTSYRFLTYKSSSTSHSSKRPLQTFTLPPPTLILPSELPSRARISQFLILPPHQSHSHGTHLYNSMTDLFLQSPTCTEITVEDPNEAFDDLRDYCDYARLTSNGTFAQISLSTTIDPKLTSKRIGVRVPTSHLLNLPLLDTLRRKNKLAPRQFYRLVEMHLLSNISPHARQAGTARLTQRVRASNDDDRAFYYWRLLVKQRIYKKNKDVLIQLERSERAEKVEETVGEVVGDYERLLRGVEKRKGYGDEGGVDGGGAEVNGSGKVGGEGRARGKRKTVIEDEDEDEGDGRGTPRRRVEGL